MRLRAIHISLCATAMTVGSLALGAAPASASIINSPGYNHIQNEGSGKCIDVGPPVEQLRCLNTFNEEWLLSDQLNNNWEIVSHTNGQCLTQEDSHANGTPVVAEPCAQLPSQTWHLIDLGTNNNKEIVQWLNLSSGQCLDLENGNTSDGVPMQVWACNSTTKNQRWQPAP
jgi:hypothetical protein